MRPIDIRIGHDNDLVIAQFVRIEGTFSVSSPDSGANRSDHGADFVVLKHLVQPGFFHIDELSTDGKNGLVFAVASLFGGTTCRVTLHNVKFGVFGIAVGAVGQFSWETPSGQVTSSTTASFQNVNNN